MRAKNELHQLSEAYQHVLLEAVNGNEIDLNTDPSAQKVQKKAIPLQFRVTDRPETIETLEGSVEAPTGAYIMTGTKGENWPIPADKFEETYDIIDAWGDGGKASKKAIPVPAKQMQEDFFVTVSWSPDKLNGKPGDWLVQYGPGDYGVVEASIFDETYDLLGEDEEYDSRGYADDEYDEPLHSPYHPDNIERLATGRSFGQHHDHLRKDEKDHKISGEDWIRDRKGNPIKRKDFYS